MADYRGCQIIQGIFYLGSFFGGELTHLYICKYTSTHSTAQACVHVLNDVKTTLMYAACINQFFFPIMMTGQYGYL